LEIKDPSGKTFFESYDRLILSPGTEPILPVNNALEFKNVFTLRSIDDAVSIKERLRRGRHITVIGSGFIGLEAVEALIKLKKEITLIEILPQVMPQLDPEMAGYIEEHLLLNKVSLILNDSVKEFSGNPVEKIILKKLEALADHTKWEGDEIVVGALKGSITVAFGIMGAYVALALVRLSPEILAVIQKGLLIFIILTVTIILARIAVGFVNNYSKKAKGNLPSTSIFTNLTKIVIIAIGLLIILQSLGISITPLLTALGIGGLAVALALQETLSSLFAGIHILASGQIRPGDYIRLESGDEGYVTDITWRNTTIRALPNNMVIIPNSKLASAIITNYYLPEKEMGVLVPVGVSYDSDLEKVEKITIEVAKEVEKSVTGGVPEFNPFIRYNALADFSINFVVILRAREFVDQHLLRHEFIKKLHQRYNKEGIEIPFPIRTIYMKKEQ